MVDLVLYPVYELTLYFFHVSPFLQEVAHDSTFPSPAVYGKHESETIPVFL